MAKGAYSSEAFDFICLKTRQNLAFLFKKQGLRANQGPCFKSFQTDFQGAKFEVHMSAPVWVSSLSAGNPIPLHPPFNVECEKTEHVPPLLPRTFPQHSSQKSYSRIPEFQASWRLLWQPVAQISHMGSDKSSPKIKNFTAPPGSAKTTPKSLEEKRLR